MENIFESLSESALFKGIPLSKVEQLFKSHVYQVKKFKKDEIIAFHDNPCEMLMILIFGSVRGEMADISGKLIKIEDINAPSPIAAAFIFGDNNKFPVDIIANEPTAIMMIPKDILLKVLQSEQIFLRNFLNIISNRTQFLSQKLYFLSFKTIKGKIAHYLLNLSSKEGVVFNLPVSQTSLAAFFGVTRPSLARVFKELENEKLIKVRQKEIYILNKEKLTNLVD